jgi:hypothetical protein
MGFAARFEGLSWMVSQEIRAKFPPNQQFSAGMVTFVTM